MPSKAGLVFAHDGHDSFSAVVLDPDAGKIGLHKITHGSGDAGLDDAALQLENRTMKSQKDVSGLNFGLHKNHPGTFVISLPR